MISRPHFLQYTLVVPSGLRALPCSCLTQNLLGIMQLYIVVTHCGHSTPSIHDRIYSYLTSNSNHCLVVVYCSFVVVHAITLHVGEYLNQFLIVSRGHKSQCRYWSDHSFCCINVKS